MNIGKITRGLTNLGSDAFSHVHLKASSVNPDGEDKLATEISRQASDAVSGYAKAAIKQGEKLLVSASDYEDEMKILLKKIPKTRESDVISLDSAVKELDMLSLSEQQKADLILACTFQTKSKETIVSRPALYMAKYVILDTYDKAPNKLDSAIRSAVYDEGKVFDIDAFYGLFKPRTWTIKRGVTLRKNATGSDELSAFNMERKGNIFDAVRAHSTPKERIVHIKTSDMFASLDSVSEDLSKKLDNIVHSGTDIPVNLQETMKKALKEYNFDLKKVFTDYYSLLKDCKTLDDVKSVYPELKYPVKPIKKDVDSRVDLSTRLKNGDMSKSVIEALRKLYTELTPEGVTFVHIDGSTATNILNLKRAGYEFSKPSDDLLAFFKECEKTQALYKAISKLSKEKLDPLIEKHAQRESGVWKDYLEMTKGGMWLPVRLIKNKRFYPETTKYSTPELVDSYLFNLYTRNPYQRYSPNPLSRFDGVNYLSDHAHGILSRTYLIRFKAKDKGIPADMSYSDWAKAKEGFEEFKKQFDIEAIGESIEHLEDVMHRHFYRNYWTDARFETLQKQLQKSRDAVYEKVLWGEELRNKEVKLEDAKRIINKDEGVFQSATEEIKLIDEKDFKNFKYQTYKIKDPALRDKFQSAIAQGRDTDEKYFSLYQRILNECDFGKNIDETKAKALISIHEKYMSEVLADGQKLSEDEFTRIFLEKYKSKSGKVDFGKILSDTNAESDYWILASKLIDKGALDFLTELERRYQADYSEMNSIIKRYLATPKEFRQKFASIYTYSAPSCPNVVLQRELDAFLERIEKWHFDKDEIIEFGQGKLTQTIAIPKETKSKLWKLAAGNYDNFDELIQKLYRNGKKRTGESGGTGIKTFIGDDFDAEIKVLGKWGDFRLYGKKATPEDIEKYGNVKYVFTDAVNHH
ncbi:hypothetical protein J6I39_03495 [bacterium]|nr:hypothetical protein [bacterium]